MDREARCSVEIDGNPCLNEVISFDWDWDAFECSDHHGWWEAQALPGFDHNEWMKAKKGETDAG